MKTESNRSLGLIAIVAGSLVLSGITPLACKYFVKKYKEIMSPKEKQVETQTNYYGDYPRMSGRSIIYKDN